MSELRRIPASDPVWVDCFGRPQLHVVPDPTLAGKALCGVDYHRGEGTVVGNPTMGLKPLCAACKDALRADIPTWEDRMASEAEASGQTMYEWLKHLQQADPETAQKYRERRGRWVENTLDGELMDQTTARQEARRINDETEWEGTPLTAVAVPYPYNSWGGDEKGWTVAYVALDRRGRK